MHWWEVYSAGVVLAVLALSVWPQGLFFNYSALIAAGMMLLAGGLVAGTLDRRAWWMLAPWVLQAAGFALSLTGAIDVGAAQQGALLHLSLLAMAGVAWVMANDPDFTRFFLGFAGYFTALLAFLIPLYSAHLVQIFSGVLFNTRWATVFQYPDTAGAVFGAGWLALSCYAPKRAWERSLARGAMVINGAALLLATSRGADLVMPIGVLAVLAVAANRATWGRLASSMIVGGVGSLLLSLVWHGRLPGLSWGPVLFLGIVAAIVAAWWAGERVADRLSASARRLALLGAAVLVVLAGGLYLGHKSGEPVPFTQKAPYQIAFNAKAGSVVRVTATAPVQVTLVGLSRYDAPTPLKSSKVSGTGRVTVPALGPTVAAVRVEVKPRSAASAELKQLVAQNAGRTQNLLPWYVHALPASLYTRLLEVNGRQLSVWQRGVFVSDGIHMASQRPLLGYGAGGWGAGYYAFQSLPYTSREVHNGWVQWWIGGGALAGLAYAGLMAGICYAAYRARRLRSDRRLMAAGLIGVNVVLIGHGILDWDFSFLWINLFVAAAWAVMMRVSLGRTDEVPRRASGGWPLWVAGTASGLAALLTFLLASGQGYANAASAAAQKNQLTLALQKVQRALSASPSLGAAEQLYTEIESAMSLQKNSGVPASKVLGLYQRTLALLPYSGTMHAAYGIYLNDAGQGQKAVGELESAVNLAPMQVSVVNTALNGLYDVIVQGLTQSHRADTLAGVRGLDQALARYRQARSSIPPGMVDSLKLPPPSGAGALAVALDDLVDGHVSKSQQEFSALKTGKTANTAGAWLQVITLLSQGSAAQSKAGTLGTVAKNLSQFGLVK